MWEQARACTRCPQLAQTRTTVVFGSGNADADLMFVGEAPGANEDKQGLPFVGQAGRLLDTLLGEIGLTRGDVFVANVLKCRPPGNRDPLPQEIDNCQDYLFRQLELIEPKVVCTLGNFATKLLRGDMTGITRLHGRDELRQIGPRVVRLYPLFHPAAALYTPAMLATLRADFARIPDLLAKPAPEQPAPEPEPEPEPVHRSAGTGARARRRALRRAARAVLKPETWAIVGGRRREPGAPLNTPLVPASNFVHGTERIYSRSEGTETWEAFEAVLGGLEGGRAVAFASGMAAASAILRQLPTGAHLVIPDDCYQAVAGIAEDGAATHGWRVERFAPSDTGAWIEAALEADLLWLESPTNPLLETADIAAICAAPRKAGTRVVGRQHVRHAAAAAAAQARRRPRDPRGDEVHRRPLRPADGRRGHRRRRRSTSCCAPCARSTARPRARSRASSPCAGCARCPVRLQAVGGQRAGAGGAPGGAPGRAPRPLPGLRRGRQLRARRRRDRGRRLRARRGSSGTPPASAASRRRWSAAASIPARSTSRTG